MMKDFKAALKRESARVDDFLASCLDGFTMPAGLKEAMNYSLLAGGKRLRPLLCLASAGLFGLEAELAMPFAAAIELVHCYSLIHDDLPAMDDDDMRRNLPSSHRRFGEATAILAGDALLTDSFCLMASAAERGATPEATLRAMHELALAAGSSGMVGGQFLDMLYTGQGSRNEEDLARMQAAKTGALIAASCACGAILAGAGEGGVEDMRRYGRALGRAFQIVDDILDETGEEAVLGKPVGSDAARGKLTYPALAGIERSRLLAWEAGRDALAVLESYRGEYAAFLADLVTYTLTRVS